MNFYATLFWAYVASALILFTFLVPPFQKSDEPAHYFRSVSLTNLDFVCSKDARGEGYFEMKRKYAELADALHVWEVAFMYNAKFKTEWLRADFSDPSFDQTVPVYDVCNLSPAGYLPNALGILAGKPFENPLVGFYLGRVFGALFFCCAIIAALRIVPERYKLLIYLYAAIPMVLHQAGAISYDVVSLSLSPLIFAFLARFMTREEPVERREFLVFTGLLLWSVNVRLVAYVPLLLLAFLIPRSRLSSSLQGYLRLTASYLATAIVTTLALTLLYLNGSDFLAPDAVGISASSQLKFVLEHPWHFLAASYRTLQINGDLIMREGFGIFGWIDYAFNFVPYYAGVLVGGLATYYMAERDVLVLSRTQLVVLWSALAGTVAALFLSLYAVWSPVGAGVVGGLQGRYFIGLLPFGVFAVSQTALYVGRRRFMQMLALVLGLFVLASIFKAIEGRYY